MHSHALARREVVSGVKAEVRYSPQIVTAWFKQHGIEPVAEHRFDPSRRWRFDFAWPDKRLALECEGGVWTGGRHTRGSGFVKDIEKYNSAVRQGWRILRCVPNDLCTLDTIKMVKESMANG